MKVAVGVEVMTKAFDIHWGNKRKVVRILVYVIAIIMLTT